MDIKNFLKDYKPNGVIRGNKIRRRYSTPVTIPNPAEGFSVVIDNEVLFNKKAGTSENEIIHDIKIAGYKGKIDIITNVANKITQTRYKL